MGTLILQEELTLTDDGDVDELEAEEEELEEVVDEVVEDFEEEVEGVLLSVEVVTSRPLLLSSTEDMVSSARRV